MTISAQLATVSGQLAGTISGQLILTGDGHGRHVPGTPDEWRHGWIPLTEAAARSHFGKVPVDWHPPSAHPSRARPAAGGGDLKGEVDRLRASLPAAAWTDYRLAADGGPGVAMMAANATVRKIGSKLAGELDRRVQARMDAGPGPKERARLATLSQAAQDAFSTYTRKHGQAMDQAARQHGFASFEALDKAFRDTPALADAERMFGIMSDVNRSADRAAHRYLARWRELRRESDQAQRDVNDMHRKKASVTREETMRLLQEVRGDAIGGKGLTYQGRNRYTQVHSRPTSAKAVRAVRFAEAGYPQAWLGLARKHSGPDGYSLISPVPRGDYTDQTRTIRLSESPGRVAGDPGSGRVATHELAHVMEQAVPGLLQLEQAEIWRRTSRGEIGHRIIDTPEPMNGYTGEYARADHFPLAYSGKDYGQGGLGADAYELFSTGAESLLAGSPYLDKAFRAWMLGVMATLGREAG